MVSQCVGVPTQNVHARDRVRYYTNGDLMCHMYMHYAIVVSSPFLMYLVKGRFFLPLRGARE